MLVCYACKYSCIVLHPQYSPKSAPEVSYRGFEKVKAQCKSCEKLDIFVRAIGPMVHLAFLFKEAKFKQALLLYSYKRHKLKFTMSKFI